MSDFFTDFPKTSSAEWKAKIIADLKGKDPSILAINDPIEDLQLSSYYHNEDQLNVDQVPGNYPYMRGMNTPNNEWNNGFLIEVDDEKAANAKALWALNSGADLLVFKDMNSSTNWATVLNTIQLEYIQTQFVVHSREAFDELRKTVSTQERYVSFNLDFLEDSWNEDDFNTIAQQFNSQQQAFCSVNGFKIQQVGANTWQEIAFCLSTGHEYLSRLMNQGFSIDEAAACISFKVGIGSNYFYEIAKFRALKDLWSKVVTAYKPAHACSYNCSITAVAGHMNKSLQDPHTNLLRQTTEAMSAIAAGINGIVILPYDLRSTNGASQLAERMALNMTSILKEESYFNKVVDPLGGSYSIEQITTAIGKKAWTYFQTLETSGSPFSTEGKNILNASIHTTRTMRTQAFQKGEITGIGINKYHSDTTSSLQWDHQHKYLGMAPLILENEYKTEAV